MVRWNTRTSAAIAALGLEVLAGKEEIIERVLTTLTREVDLIMQEGVVADTRDVDLAMIMGAGWPFFMGGITMYLDMAGYTPKVLQKVFLNIVFRTRLGSL